MFSEVSLRLGYGGTLLVTGETRTTRTLLLALSGRLSQIEGRLRVDGLLVPERAGAVRARVGVALLDDPAEPPPTSPAPHRAAPGSCSCRTSTASTTTPATTWPRCSAGPPPSARAQR